MHLSRVINEGSVLGYTLLGISPYVDPVLEVGIPEMISKQTTIRSTMAFWVK